MGLEVDVEYSEEHEIECPFCKKKSIHVINGIAHGEIEPPDRDGPDL